MSTTIATLINLGSAVLLCLTAATVYFRHRHGRDVARAESQLEEQRQNLLDREAVELVRQMREKQDDLFPGDPNLL